MTYYENLSISNSSLSVFSYDPSYFHKVFITKELTDKKESDAMLLGSIIHCLLLEPSEFEKRYFVSSVTPEETPSGMMLDYVKTLATFETVDEIAHEAAYIKSGYKISREKVIENYNKSTSFKKYLEELKDPRQLVSQFMNDSAKTHAQNVQDSPYWKKVLGDKEWEEFKELEIYWSSVVSTEGCDVMLPLKSKLDHLFVNVDNQGKKGKLQIKYFDYKTDSQKPVHKYQDSFEYWKTYRQFGFYWLAINEWAKQTFPGFEVEVQMYVVPIDVVRMKTVIYEVCKSYIAKGISEVDKDLSDLAWHMCTDQWEFPRKMYEQDIPVLRLDGDECE
jgi:hypothetical protein